MQIVAAAANVSNDKFHGFLVSLVGGGGEGCEWEEKGNLPTLPRKTYMGWL